MKKIILFVVVCTLCTCNLVSAQGFTNQSVTSQNKLLLLQEIVYKSSEVQINRSWTNLFTRPLDPENRMIMGHATTSINYHGLDCFVDLKDKIIILTLDESIIRYSYTEEKGYHNTYGNVKIENVSYVYLDDNESAEMEMLGLANVALSDLTETTNQTVEKLKLDR